MWLTSTVLLSSRQKQRRLDVKILGQPEGVFDANRALAFEDFADGNPALLTGLCYSFARCMTSVSTVVFLVTPQTKIMTSQILDAANNGRYSEGNAEDAQQCSAVRCSHTPLRRMNNNRSSISQSSADAN